MIYVTTYILFAILTVTEPSKGSAVVQLNEYSNRAECGEMAEAVAEEVRKTPGYEGFEVEIVCIPFTTPESKEGPSQKDAPMRKKGSA